MWIGDVVADRFVVQRPIGSGGMGSVFVAADRATATISADPVAASLVTYALAGQEMLRRNFTEALKLLEASAENARRGGLHFHLGVVLQNAAVVGSSWVSTNAPRR